MERKRVPDIAGVSRGFPSGVPIDAAAQFTAERTKERFSKQRSDLFLIDFDRRSYLNFPVLIEGLKVNAPTWMPRYDPTSGTVYTIRWNEPDLGNGPLVIDSQDGLFVKTKDKTYLVIGGEKLPFLKKSKRVAKSWDIRQLIPQKVEDGIEAAMRQQDEIMRDYRYDVGVETEQVTDLLSQIKELFTYFGQETISQDTFEKVAIRTHKIFESHGLVNARDPFKKEIVQTLNNVSILDRLNRKNPSAAKWRLTSVLIKVVKRKLVTNFASDKSVRTFSVLLTEREVERLNLEDAKRIMRKIGGFSGWIEANIFSSGYMDSPKEIPDLLITRAGEFLETIVTERLRSAKVAPYLLPTRIIEAMLVGRRLDKNKSTDKILSGYTAYKELDEPSVLDLLRMRKPEEALVRFSDAYNLLKELLSDPDHKVYTL